MINDNEDTPVDWAVMAAAIAFLSIGLGAPYLLWAHGGLHVSEWGLDSWQTYVSIICFVVYLTLGKVANDMRKDDET
jgi:membrane protein implicated in regulation of membrane protease activity